MVTLRDIAEETGYHVSTVSQVLSGGPRGEQFAADTRQAIRAAAKRMQYRPHLSARALKSGRTRLIGVVGFVFGHRVWGRQMRGLVHAFRAKGYSTMFLDNEESSERDADCLREMAAHRVEALLVASERPSPETIAAVPQGVPTVFFVHRFVEGWPCLMLDRAAAVGRAVERLMELGHRRIAFLTGRISTNLSKLDGYAAALESAGAFDEGLVFEVGDAPGAALKFFAACKGAATSATAFVCSNDRFAGETMMALRAVGLRVPEDASVVGFDDSDMVYMTRPPLASIRYPVDEVIGHAARMVLDAAEGRPVESVVLTPRFVERGSVGPIAVPV